MSDTSDMVYFGSKGTFADMILDAPLITELQPKKDNNTMHDDQPDAESTKTQYGRRANQQQRYHNQRASVDETTIKTLESENTKLKQEIDLLKRDKAKICEEYGEFIEILTNELDQHFCS